MAKKRKLRTSDGAVLVDEHGAEATEDLLPSVAIYRWGILQVITAIERKRRYVVLTLQDTETPK